MEYGCCIGVEYYGQVAAAGYDNITLPCHWVASAPRDEFRRGMETVRQGPLRLRGLNAFCKPDLRLTGPNFTLGRVADYSGRLLERAALMGVETIGIGCPGSRNVPKDYGYPTCVAQFEEVLGTVCALAGPLGIDILLESVCTVEGNFITTMAEAYGFIRRLGLPNLHLVYDVYHSHMMGEGAQVVALMAADIRTVHMARDVGGHRHYLNENNAAEYRVYIEELRRADYDGEISVEAFYGDLAADLPKSLAILKSM